jgi:four helix bundle protein
VRNFRELKVWRKSHSLTLAVYEATVAFPKQELYGLTGQVRRFAAFVPANIAEGCGRNGDAELARFLQIASGSASELEYHILFAHDLKLLKTPEYETLAREVVEIKRMLTSFIQKLRSTDIQQRADG